MLLLARISAGCQHVVPDKACPEALSRDGSPIPASPDVVYFDPSDEETDLIIRECVDEFSIDGRAIVFRERHPLEDGQRRRIIDRSITRRVTRFDNPRVPPPGVSTASSTPILTVDKVTTLLPSVSGRPTFEDHARALSIDIPTALQRLNAGDFWPSTEDSYDPFSSSDTVAAMPTMPQFLPCLKCPADGSSTPRCTRRTIRFTPSVYV